MEAFGWSSTRSSVKNMGNDKIRDLIIIFDCVRYDNFVKASTPTLDSLGEAALAWTHGTWTRPSMVSILSGYLPYNKKYKNPYGITHKLLGIGIFGKEVPSYFFHAGAWMRFAGPSAYQELTDFGSFPAKKMVEGARELMEREKEFLIVILFPETHGNYHYEPEPGSEIKRVLQLFGDYNIRGYNNDAPAVAAERSRNAISHLDQTIKPLLPLAERIVFTADHGDLMGEHHLIGHDPGYPFHEVLLKVPLIIG